MRIDAVVFDIEDYGIIAPANSDAAYSWFSSRSILIILMQRSIAPAGTAIDMVCINLGQLLEFLTGRSVSKKNTLYFSDSSTRLSGAFFCDMIPVAVRPARATNVILHELPPRPSWNIIQDVITTIILDRNPAAEKAETWNL